jgi:hypothetical protein
MLMAKYVRVKNLNNSHRKVTKSKSHQMKNSLNHVNGYLAQQKSLRQNPQIVSTDAPPRCSCGMLYVDHRRR